MSEEIIDLVLSDVTPERAAIIERAIKELSKIDAPTVAFSVDAIINDREDKASFEIVESLETFLFKKLIESLASYGIFLSEELDLNIMVSLMASVNKLDSDALSGSLDVDIEDNDDPISFMARHCSESMDDYTFEDFLIILDRVTPSILHAIRTQLALQQEIEEREESTRGNSVEAIRMRFHLFKEKVGEGIAEDLIGSGLSLGVAPETALGLVLDDFRQMNPTRVGEELLGVLLLTSLNTEDILQFGATTLNDIFVDPNDIMTSNNVFKDKFQGMYR